ncbi:flavodoxin-dependent (E)-4-hydroxy-3-methylbut-2-enyl-diphosphate synthase [Mycobacterium tuberculosis]
MCTTKTHDVNSTLQQIAELTAAGCDIVRVACPRQEDADALAEIARRSQIPVVADIHFQPRYIFAAIDADVPRCGSTRATSRSLTAGWVRSPRRRVRPDPDPNRCQRRFAGQTVHGERQSHARGAG